MADKEKPPEYWEGVYDTLKLIQEFLDLKDEHPNSQRTVEDYLNAALSKVNRQLTSDLRQLIGFEQEVAEEKAQKEIPEEPSTESLSAEAEQKLDSVDMKSDAFAETAPHDVPDEMRTEPLDIPPPSLDEPLSEDLLEPLDEELLGPTEKELLEPLDEDFSVKETDENLEEKSLEAEIPEKESFTPLHEPSSQSSAETRFEHSKAETIPPVPELEEIELPPPIDENKPSEKPEAEAARVIEQETEKEADSGDSPKEDIEENGDPFI
ncbi:MAG: hypothetical protein ACTSW4_01085 [Candidatus Ranarchaeia archaeon]